MDDCLLFAFGNPERDVGEETDETGEERAATSFSFSNAFESARLPRFDFCVKVGLLSVGDGCGDRDDWSKDRRFRGFLDVVDMGSWAQTRKKKQKS